MTQRKQSSTSYPVPFLMVDSGDDLTGLTGLTPVVTLSKNGGAFVPAIGAVSEVGNGWYALAGNAVDRDTLGSLVLHATASGANAADVWCEIVAWNPYDQYLGFGVSNISPITSLIATTLSIRRGDRFSQALTVETIPDDWLKLWITAKADVEGADTAALFQVLLSNPGVGTDGLQRLNGMAITAAWGSLTKDTPTGITIALNENATSLLGRQQGVRFDVQVLSTVAGVDTIGTGRVDVDVETDVTRAIS